MKNILNRYLPTLLLLMTLTMWSCEKWTEVQSVDLETPTLEDQNPELYARYMESIREYKKSDHLVMYVSHNNTNEVISHRSQHITVLPDSVDYIVLQDAAGLSSQLQAEMSEVRSEKGTTVLYNIDYADIVSAWNAILEQEELDAAAAASQSANTDFVEEPSDGESGDGEGDSGVEEDDEEEVVVLTDEERFLIYCKEQTTQMLSYCGQYGFDGIEIDYTGVALESMTDSALETVTAQQEAFIGVVEEWYASNTSKLLTFRGTPNCLVDKTILNVCKFIIIPATTSTGASELTVLVNRAMATGVPSDRFLIAVSTPVLDDDTSMVGYFQIYNSDGSYLSAISGAATWVVEGSSDYTKAGVAVDNVERDYYNYTNIFSRVKAGIKIMNP